MTLDQIENNWHIDSIVDGLLKYVMSTQNGLEPWKLHLAGSRRVEYYIKFHPSNEWKYPLIVRSNQIDSGYHPDFTLEVESLADQKIKVSWPTDTIDEIYLVYLQQSNSSKFYSTFNSTSKLPWLEIDCSQEPSNYAILDLTNAGFASGTYSLSFILRKGHIFTHYTETNIKLLNPRKAKPPLERKHVAKASLEFDYLKNLKVRVSYRMNFKRAKVAATITRIVKLGPNGKNTLLETPIKCKRDSQNQDICYIPKNIIEPSRHNFETTYMIFYTYNLPVGWKEYVQNGISVASPRLKSGMDSDLESDSDF